MLGMVMLGVFVTEAQQPKLKPAVDDAELWTQMEVGIPDVFCKRCGCNVTRASYTGFKDDKGESALFFCPNHFHLSYDEVIKVVR